MGQDMQQWANKNREEEDCKLVKVDLNNAGLKILASKMFYEEGIQYLFVNLFELKNTLDVFW